MAAPLSVDLRVRVMADVDSGISAEDAAEKYSVTARTVYNWKALVRETGSLQPRDGTPGPKRKLEESRAGIESALAENPGLTLEDLKASLQLPVCVSTLWTALRSWGIVLTKSPQSGRAAAS